MDEGLGWIDHDYPSICFSIFQPIYITNYIDKYTYVLYIYIYMCMCMYTHNLCTVENRWICQNIYFIVHMDIYIIYPKISVYIWIFINIVTEKKLRNNV